MIGPLLRRWPAVAATLTTITAFSVLLLVGAGMGWPGDTMSCFHGGCLCEVPKVDPHTPWSVAQPANSWSNLSFLLVGLAIAYSIDSQRPVSYWQNFSSTPTSSSARHLSLLTAHHNICPIVYACVVAYLGLGSFAMHASLQQWGANVDLLSMVYYMGGCFGYSFLRLLWLLYLCFYDFKASTNTRIVIRIGTVTNTGSDRKHQKNKEVEENAKAMEEAIALDMCASPETQEEVLSTVEEEAEAMAEKEANAVVASASPETQEEISMLQKRRDRLVTIAILVYFAWVIVYSFTVQEKLIATFPILVKMCAVLEIVIQIFNKCYHGVCGNNLVWLLAAFVTFGSGYGIWNISNTEKPFCFAESWLQGHAIWHCFCALTTGFVFTFVLSERPPICIPAERAL